MEGTMFGRKTGGSIVILLSLIAGFGSGVARAGIGINTLRGIDRIKVVVEDLTGDSTMAGVTEEGLRTQSELALRQIGLTAITDSNSAGAGSLLTPILYLSLSTDRADGFHTFLIRLELWQAVTLTRDPIIKASSAITWSAVRFGRVDERGYASKVRTVLTILLQSFQDDYLSVNPATWPPRDRTTITSSSNLR
jgi:hypothetical protein